MTSRLLVDKIEGKTTSGTIQMPEGHVIQTQRNVDKTNVVDMTSGSYTEVGSSFRCSITPKFSSSKMLVFASFHIVAHSSQSSSGVKVMRSSDGASSFSDITDYGHGSTTESHRVTGSNSLFHSNTYVMLDEPATTNALIYSYFAATNGTIRFNDNGGGCRIIVQEIAG